MNKEQKRYLQQYYQRNNIPPVLLDKIMNEVTMSTRINRNFYRSLRNRGRTHYQIMRMIQPERLAEFTKDVYPIFPTEHRGVKAPSLFEKIYNIFF